MLQLNLTEASLNNSNIIIQWGYKTLTQYIQYILSSALIIALIWVSIWSYSIYKANQRHKEIIKRLERIEKKLH